MSEENDKSEPLDSLERTLARFAPAPPRIERDRLMFLAGQASREGSGFGVQGSGGVSLIDAGRDCVPGTQYLVLSTECLPPTNHLNTGHTEKLRRNWFWPASTAALAATSLALAMALLLRPQPRVLIVERDTLVSPPAVAQREVASPPENFQIAASARRQPEASRVPAENYLRTREVALRMGLDAIGSQQIAAGISTPPTYGDLLLGLTASRQPSDGGTERHENLSNM